MIWGLLFFGIVAGSLVRTSPIQDLLWGAVVVGCFVAFFRFEWDVLFFALVVIGAFVLADWARTS
jgi:hypothetical protein